MNLAEPLGLILLGAALVLVYFHLRERRRQVCQVPSLLLWQSLRSDRWQARRFRPNWLFWLQLAALATLSIALAHPYLGDGGESVAARRRVMVLDGTASTQASDVRPSRFEALKQQLLAAVDAASADDEIALIVLGARAQLRVPFTSDHAQISAALAAVTPVDGGGDLAGALRLAQEVAAADASVELFTDTNGLLSVPDLPSSVKRVVVGEHDDNLGIAALDVVQGRFDAVSQARVHVQVRNYSRREQHTLLTVRIGEQVVTRRGLTLAADAAQDIVVRDLPGPGLVAAELSGGDFLAADDVAYGWLYQPEPALVRISSEASPLAGDLAGFCRRLGIEVADDAVAGHGEADLVIFDRRVPSELPPSNVLFLFPPPGNRLFPVLGEAEGVEVLDWNAQHPIMAGLQPAPAAPFARAAALELPEWATALLWTRDQRRQFPLAFAGELDGHRIVVLTFDLEAEGLGGNDRVDRVMLFGSILSWLLPRHSAVLMTRAGQAVSLPNALRDRELEVTRGSERQVRPAATSISFDEAGAYQVSADDDRGVLLVNAGDPAESAIGAKPPAPPKVIEAEKTQRSVVHETMPRSLRSWFYGAALTCLLVEWAAQLRRPR